MVLAGAPTLRHPGRRGACWREATSSASWTVPAVRIASSTTAHSRPGYVILSTMGLPVTAHYPDSDKILIRDADGSSHVFRKADAVDYWDGER